MQFMLPPGGRQQIPVQGLVPPGTPRGAHSELTVQVTAPGTMMPVKAGTTQLEYYVAGMTRFGDGTPGCLGAHTIDADGPMVAGGPAVQFTCDAVQPGAIGFWLYGPPVGGNYGSLSVAGTELLVDPFAALLDLTVAGPAGVFVAAIQCPNVQSLRGLDLTTQAVSLGDAGCVLQVFPLTSSPAIEFVIQ
jgi:hypothetical protein